MGMDNVACTLGLTAEIITFPTSRTPAYNPAARRCCCPSGRGVVEHEIGIREIEAAPLVAVSGGPTMTTAMLDAAGSGFVAAEAAGPLEQQHLQYANYRAVADSSKVTWTLAHRPGWRFDGMNGVLFELLSSLLSKRPCRWHWRCFEHRIQVFVSRAIMGHR